MAAHHRLLRWFHNVFSFFFREFVAASKPLFHGNELCFVERDSWCFGSLVWTFYDKIINYCYKKYYFRQMKPNEIQEIKNLLQKQNKIAIIPHRNPDGDAMGSTLALFHYLKKLNQTVTVISPNEFPDFLAWMPASNEVLIYEKNTAVCTKILQNADLIFTLDFNAFHRTGEMENVLAKCEATFVMIDHHEKPDNYAQYTFSDTSYGSTCQMVYDFIDQLGGKNLLDKDIATCIYTGILTDSGSFKYPKTTGTTHRIVAHLIDLGAENTEIPSLLFDNNSYNRLQLMGRAFQNMKIFLDKKTTYMTLSQSELDYFHFTKGDTEGLVNYGLTIKGINFAAIFIENKQEGIIKISFRSQGSFDVNEFSRNHFEGGGHINAAGGKSNLSLTETIIKFENLIEQL
jgi:bifunctional oligoribonuclease and PAP phosphatase NrnA